jgi:putative transposase
VSFALVLARKAEYPVALMCRALSVSRSGYYTWEERSRAPQLEEAPLGVRIREIFDEHKRRYGAPRVHAQLRREGFKHSRKRVARIMRQRGLRARPQRRFCITTTSQHDLPIAPNKVARQFTVAAPNSVWAADITYIETGEGWLYLAVILDLATRAVVGWATSDSLHRDVCIRALRQALRVHKPPIGLLHHSDRGSQYASKEHRALLARSGIRASMSRAGDCWDNAVVESFFATLKKELIYRTRFSTRAEADADLAHYLDVYYNHKRVHSHLGYRTPREAALDYQRSSMAA